jgi:hypothetical protein
LFSLLRIVTDPPSDAGARLRALGFAARAFSSQVASLGDSENATKKKSGAYLMSECELDMHQTAAPVRALVRLRRPQEAQSFADTGLSIMAAKCGDRDAPS